MKYLYVLILVGLFSIPSNSQENSFLLNNQAKVNKEIATNFYKDLWFTNNTNQYEKYVADEYVVHDIGNRKGITEPAIEQKNIADFFWENGDFECKIDFQIAEGDLVATRWTGFFKAKTIFGKIALEADKPISIINVFRINDGKIVEFWNHRHDIETPQTLKFTLRGLILGLFIGLFPTIWAIRLKQKLNKTVHNNG